MVVLFVIFRIVWARCNIIKLYIKYEMMMIVEK
jgi:hypothetical protein